MVFFDYFQLIALVLFYVLFIGRTVQLLLRGTNPLVLGVGKKGGQRLLELAFLLGLVLWSYEVLAHALHWRFHIVPGIVYGELLRFLPLQVLGCALIVAGIHFQILQEERFLQGHYGPAYAEYRRRVRRYL